jgi:hypothetical protein
VYLSDKFRYSRDVTKWQERPVYGTIATETGKVSNQTLEN